MSVSRNSIFISPLGLRVDDSHHDSASLPKTDPTQSVIAVLLIMMTEILYITKSHKQSLNRCLKSFI